MLKCSQVSDELSCCLEVLEKTMLHCLELGLVYSPTDQAGSAELTSDPLSLTPAFSSGGKTNYVHEVVII